MFNSLNRSFEDQLVRGVLCLLLFSAGVVQLFFITEVQKRLLRLREYLNERHPRLVRLFGSPLRTIDLKGYTVGKRIGGIVLIILSIVLLIIIFQSPDPCDDYWSMTRSNRC